MGFLYIILEAIKSLFIAIAGSFNFILRIFNVEILSKKEKEILEGTESLIQKHWGSPVSIHDLTTLVNGLTPIEMKPVSIEFYPDSTDTVSSLPLHKMPKTAHFSFAVKGLRMTRWQLYFYQEASFLLEKDKAFMIKHKSDGFSISVSKRFNNMDVIAIKDIPAKDRIKLAYANALYAEIGKGYQLQSVYCLQMLVGKTSIASILFTGYDDIQNAWIAYYKGIYGSAPDAETMQKALSCPVSYAEILNAEERSRVCDILRLKNGVKNVEKLIKKYSPKPKKKESFASGIDLFGDTSSHTANRVATGAKNSELEKIWEGAYLRLFTSDDENDMDESTRFDEDSFEFDEDFSELDEDFSELDEERPEISNGDYKYSSSYSRSSSSSYSSKSSSGNGPGSSNKSTKAPKANSSPKRDTHYEEERVRRCQAELEHQKQNRDTAKQNGNYKRSAKNYRKGDKVGNVYDANVWSAEEELRRAKEALANARKR